VKRKMTGITTEAKKEIIAKHENGVRVSIVLLSLIWQNKDTIKGANIARGVTVLAADLEKRENVNW
jgi:hypothetical protein